jgi:hypothetical protein
MRLFSYIVTKDSGFAPNPFHGFCTLACCKPVIRRVAKVGDWIVGLSKGGVGIVYAMKVGEKLAFRAYWPDRRFRSKRPGPAAHGYRELPEGDNIYEPTGKDEYRQHRSRHSLLTGEEDTKRKRIDLGGKFVLVANDSQFVYFGTQSRDLPSELDFLRVGRGHRSRFSDEHLKTFLSWVRKQRRGRISNPAGWPDDGPDGAFER